MRTPRMSTKRVLGLAMATALAVGGTVASASISEAATTKLVITPPSGSAGVAGKILSLVGSGFKVGSTVKVGTVANHGVVFQAAACAAAPDGAAIDAATRSVPTATKIIVTAPSLGSSSDTTSTKWNVCVYSTANTPALLATGVYATLGAPVINAAIAPANGAAAGGDTVTIPGSNFGKSPKVFFGTAASPKVTVAKDGLSVDAVAPPHAAGAVQVTVVTDGGTNPVASLSAPTDDDYTYFNAIEVSDNTGPGSATNDISITGVGFNNLDFTRTGSSSAPGPSAIYLTRGAYNPAGTTSGGTTTITNAPAYTCGSPLVVSDTEVDCTVPTATDGAYTVVVVYDKRPVDSSLGADSATGQKAAPANNASVVSSSATYTVANF